MSNFLSKMPSSIVMGLAVILLNFSLAQSQTAPTQSDQPSRVSIEYVPSQNSAFQPLYDLLRERRALERIQEILSPLQVPEELTIKVTECGAVNSYYRSAQRQCPLRANSRHYATSPVTSSTRPSSRID